MKTCLKCKKQKEEKDFHKRHNRKDGLQPFCKSCRIKERKEAYSKNKEKEIKSRLNYINNNKLKYKAYCRKYAKNKYANDIPYKLARRLRDRLYKAIKRNCKKGSAVNDLGCSLTEFKLYIEAQFQPEMTWDNYGQWHIDHVIPISSFNLSDETELKEACNYLNLQPLWAKDNIKKSNKT